MKPWSWVLVAAAGMALAAAAGCNRTDQQTTPDPQNQPNEPQVRLRAGQVQKPSAQLRRKPLEVQTNRASGGVGPGPVRSSGAQHPSQTAPSPAGKGQADAIFTNFEVLRIELEIPRAGMSQLRRAGWGNGNGNSDRPTAKVTVREGGMVYTNVAVHLKGAAGSFRPIDDKPALTLSFDKFVPEQSFHGLHKISLNNSAQDSSYMAEKISRELMIAAGVPVPRAGHALVTLNGRDLGLYVLLEGANKQFLKRYFQNAKGNLYDGGFCQDIDGSLTLNCGDNPKDNSGLSALLSTMRQGRPGFARVDKVLDTDRFISMMAMEMMLCHWDGYSLNRNNWRLFHDLDSNKMVFIPHGLDQLFGVGRPFAGGTLREPSHLSGVVSRVVLASEEGRSRYQHRVEQLYTNVFKVDEIASRVDEIAAGVAASLAQSNPQLATQMQRQADRLKRRIIQRGETLRRELGAPATSLDFGQEGIVLLKGWKPGLIAAGDPVLTEDTDPSGKPLLHISTGSEGTGSGSWRTSVMLASGRYQFEGRLRLEGVVIDDGDTRGGAGLRISKSMPHKLVGTSGWTTFRYPFKVEEEVSTVELICELRAAKGEAWFDPASLRLVRLP